jgi:hypothetical protein
MSVSIRSSAHCCSPPRCPSQRLSPRLWSSKRSVTEQTGPGSGCA